MMPQRQGLILMLVMALLLCAACARPHLASAAPADTRPELQIGLVGAESGPGGVEGSYTGNAAVLAIDQINHAGGITWQGTAYRLALAYGSGSVEAQVQGLVGRNPPLVALLGPDETAPALAASPLVARAAIPQLTIATGNDLTNPVRNQNDPRIFRLRPPDAQWARAITRYVLATKSAQTIALATLDSPYGQEGGGVIQGMLGAAGMVSTTQVTLAPGLADPATPAAQLLAAHPDVVICWSTELEAALLLRALHAAGWHGQFVVGAVDGDLIALAGSDGEGIIGATNWTPTAHDPASATFIAAYQQRFGEVPDEHAAAMYDAVGVLAAALVAVGPDHAALAAYLRQLSGYNGVQGQYDAPQTMSILGTQGDLTAHLDIVRVQGAQPVIVQTVVG